MYRIIFKYTYDMDLKNKSVAFDEEELMESCLIQFYPRCDLIELHTRLRSICRWVQTRSHLKVLGALSDAKALELVADNPTEHMYKLMTIIKRIELYFVKKMEKEKKKALAAEQEALLTLDHKKTTTASSYGSSVKIHSGTNTQELQGCSWSQFLIIMSLFCSDETHLIPHLAFNITDKYVHAMLYVLYPMLYDLCSMCCMYAMNAFICDISILYLNQYPVCIPYIPYIPCIPYTVYHCLVCTL
jgi:hypothetical protein